MFRNCSYKGIIKSIIAMNSNMSHFTTDLADRTRAKSTTYITKSVTSSPELREVTLIAILTRKGLSPKYQVLPEPGKQDHLYPIHWLACQSKVFNKFFHGFKVMYDKYSGRSRRFAFVTMKTVEDANAAIEKLNGTQIGGREIKVNLTEKPLSTVDMSFLQADDSQFIDSAHKVYVGNLAKTVTNDMLQSFFSEKGKVLSAKVSRVPGTSKSSGFGFVTFSSEKDVDAAISSFNNALLEGQKNSCEQSIVSGWQ